MSGSGGKSESESSTQVDIPGFLRPFITQATGTASQALRNLSNSSRGDLVAGFTDDQLEARNRARDIANGGTLDTVENELLNISQGAGLDSFLPDSVLQQLSGFGGDGFIPTEVRQALAPGALPDSVKATLESAQGGSLPPEALAALSGASQGGLDFLPPEVLESLRSTLGSGSLPGSSINTLTAAQGQAAPDAAARLSGVSGNVDSFLPASSRDTLGLLSGGSNLNPVGTDEFGRVVEGEVIPGVSREALESTARGDFLFGGDGFDAAVDAAIRAARPGIVSTFGRAGAGGATGGLAQAAVGRSAVDAFARQFGEERGRQLSAADRLGEFGLADRSQRLDAAGRVADVGLSNNAQSLDDARNRAAAAGTLGEFGLAGRGQAIDAANLESSIDLANRGQQTDAAAILAELGLGDAGQRIDAGTRLADIGLSGRDQNINAANVLGSLDLANRREGADAAQALGGLSLTQSGQNANSAGLLAGLLGEERGRSLSASGLLANTANAERNRQLQALGLLPDASLLDVNLLQQLGGQEQELQQRFLDAPRETQLQLLAAALGGVPISSLLGQSSNESNRGFSLSFED